MKLSLAILILFSAFRVPRSAFSQTAPDEHDRPGLSIPKLPDFQPSTKEKLKLAMESVIDPAPTDYIFPAAIPSATKTLTFDCSSDWPDQVWIASSPDLFHWRLFATLNDTNALTVFYFGGNQFFRLQL